MDKVQHLWNVVNHLSSNCNVEVNALQSYYVARCREMENKVELPKKIFGAETMCSHCGSLWSQIGHRVRYVSGRRESKSIRKILNSGKRLNKIRKTLVKKAVKNSGNKMIVRCSFCSKSTKIQMPKPSRLKPPSCDKNKSDDNQTPSIKKRKKRTKDKTAGLIITPNSKSQDLKPTSAIKLTNLNRDKVIERLVTPDTNKAQDLNRVLKARATNLGKLGVMINKTLTPSKKSSLHDFITELGG